MSDYFCQICNTNACCHSLDYFCQICNTNACCHSLDQWKTRAAALEARVTHLQGEITTEKESHIATLKAFKHALACTVKENTEITTQMEGYRNLAEARKLDVASYEKRGDEYRDELNEAWKATGVEGAIRRLGVKLSEVILGRQECLKANGVRLKNINETVRKLEQSLADCLDLCSMLKAGKPL
jgi:hypothetical protein